MRQRVQPNDLILVKDSIHTLINRSTKGCKYAVELFPKKQYKEEEYVY